MAYTLPDDKTVAVKVSYTDAKGHPAKVDGDVEWSSADEQIVSVTADGSDSTQAQISPVANLGQTQITAKADADLGSGTQEILCTMDVEVVAGSAVVGTITPVGDPQTAT